VQNRFKKVKKHAPAKEGVKSKKNAPAKAGIKKGKMLQHLLFSGGKK
jgi:hypothetical protein